jgi:hypothetical protein
MVDADLLCGGRGEVHDATSDIGSPVADGDHRALTGFEVGDLGGSA